MSKVGHCHIQCESYAAAILFLSLSFWLQLVFYTTFTLKALRVFHQSIRKLKWHCFDHGRIRASGVLTFSIFMFSVLPLMMVPQSTETCRVKK
jgi:hypothetical protein